MKILRQFLIILLISLLGEILSWLLPFPVPASVYGLVLMMAALMTGAILIPQVKRSGGYLNRTDAGHVYPGGGRADDCLGEVASDGRSGDCYHLCHHPPCHGSNRACDPKGH